jgi:hypothetical protein
LLALAARQPYEAAKNTVNAAVGGGSGTLTRTSSMKRTNSKFEMINPMSKSNTTSANTSQYIRDDPHRAVQNSSPLNIPEINEITIDGSLSSDSENEKDKNDNNEGEDDGRRHFRYKVEISMLEIYNEQVYDLLNEQTGGGQSSDGVSLDIRLNQENIVNVPGLREIKVQSMDDVDAVFNRGAKNRAVSKTNLNSHSSRSHLITQVDVTIEESQGANEVKGRLFLVDLAGSERLAKSGAKGSVLKEAQYINKSLSSLGDVMEALDSKAKHIPYRNSKLTYLLQNALGANSKAMMIFTICPTDLTSDETLFTLQFAQRVRNINLGIAHRNISSKNLELSLKAAKTDLKELKKKKQALEEQLLELKKENKRAVEKSTSGLENKIRVLEEQNKVQDFALENLQRSVDDLTAKLEAEKTVKQQHLFDLELTQRNLKKALEVSKDYNAENERLGYLLKGKEQELEKLKEAVTRSILSPNNKSSKSSPFTYSSTNGTLSPAISPINRRSNSESNLVLVSLSSPSHANKSNRPQVTDANTYNDDKSKAQSFFSFDEQKESLQIRSTKAEDVNFSSNEEHRGRNGNRDDFFISPVADRKGKQACFISHTL